MSRIQLPLDVFLLLCNFLNLNDVNSNILSIRLNRTKNGIFKYPLLIDSNWIYLSEMIRCEGHLTNKRIILENTDTELLNKFKNSLLNIGLKKESLNEKLDIKLQVPLDWNIGNIPINPFYIFFFIMG